MFYDFLGFPKAQDFYNNFVTKRKPVVFQKGNKNVFYHISNGMY